MGQDNNGQGPVLRLWLLGGFRAERDGQPVPESAWQRPTARTLVKLLAAQPEHRLHQERIIDLLWPDLNPSSALSSLRKATTLARQALEPDLPPRARSAFLHLLDGVLSLDTKAVWIDADEFQASAIEAVAGQEIPAFERALALYTGDLLPENEYEDWGMDRREALGQLYLQILTGLAGVLEEQGKYTRAIDCLQAVLRREPTDEETHRRLMRLYVASGNRNQALRQYRLCNDALEAELGVEPEPETRALYADISSGRLSPVRPAAPGDGPDVQSLMLPAAVRRLIRSPLTGRERPLDVIAREIAAAGGAPGSGGADHRGLILIGGEAGVGKTRLAVEAARAAHEQGTLVLWGESHEQEGHVPYFPFVEAFERYVETCALDEREALAARFPELSPLVPSLSMGNIHSVPMADEGDAGRFRLFAAITRFMAALAEARPVLLILDDLQAADTASIRLLHHLARALPDQRWSVLGTYREEDVVRGGPLDDMRTSLARASLYREISLLRLSRADCAAIVASLLPDAPPSEELLDRVYALSLGNPLFATELVEAMRGEGLQRADAGWVPVNGELTIPARIQDLILARVSRVSPAARQVLALASAIGMESRYDVLAGAASLDDEALLDALDESIESRVLEERETGFVFRHPLLRETIYARLSRARRMHLHGSIASSLKAISPVDVEALAYHYAAAGEPEAAEWLERAGDRAAAVYASQTAVRYYRQAAEMHPEDDSVDRARLDEKLGGVLLAAGDYDDALASFQRATDWYQAAGDLESAGRATAALALAHRWRGTPEIGIQRVRPMIDVLGERGPSRALAACCLSLAHLLFLQGAYRDMLNAARRAGEIADAIGDAALKAEAHERHGTALLFLGHPREGREILERTIPLVEATGNLELLRRTLFNTGCAANYSGDPQDERHYFERALVIAERVGNPSQIAFMLGGLGVSLMNSGEWELARGTLDRAMKLARAADNNTNLSYPIIVRGELALFEGDWATARALLAEGLKVAEETGVHDSVAVANAYLGRLDLLEGNVSGAVTRLQAWARRENADTRASVWYALALLESGDEEGAASVADDVVARARESEPIMLGEGLLAQGIVKARRGEAEAAHRALCEALDVAHSLGDLHLEGRVLFQLGTSIPGIITADEIRSLLEESLTILRRLGARKDAELAEQALAAFKSAV